jgi:hypothetical protein
MPVKTGIQSNRSMVCFWLWIPAFVGMTYYEDAVLVLRQRFQKFDQVL